MMTNQNDVKRPLPPVVDDTYFQSLDPNFVEGMLRPFDFGYKSGEEWVQTVDIENVHDAAIRLTMNEQMEKLFAIYHYKFVELEENYDESDFTMVVTEPTRYVSKLGSAISDYFLAMQYRYYFFMGSEEVAQHGYAICDLPNNNFRSFEDGWAQSVRDYYLSQLIDYEQNNQ